MAAKFDDVKPWPAQKAPPQAVGSQPGHNRPVPSEDALREFRDLLAQRSGLEQRITDLLGSASRAAATDQESAGRCGELVKQVSAAIKVIEDARVNVKEPYLAATRAIDSAAREKALPLVDARAVVQGKLNTFVREEEQRRVAEARRAEEARRVAAEEQRQREAEAAKAGQAAPEPEPVYAPAPAAEEPTRIRGDYGTLTSARKVWKHEITDITVAFMAVEKNANVREAIDKAIAALVRSGIREIEGVRIFEDTVAQVR
ncbi:hypothetical protein [Sphingomonas sp.]|uniref:hypothetical protein n=1 Tax=Sphingomonas sp. TaxID=28214 RepID=UPI003B3B929B